MGKAMPLNRGWSLRLYAIVLGVMIAACRPADAAEITELKVGISEAVNTVLAFWMAEEGGFFRDQGLNIKILNMGGGSRGAQELQTGSIDMMHVGLSSVVRVNRDGGDLRLVASLSNVIRFTLFAVPAVRTAADLRGGVIGISTFGSETDTTVSLALMRLNLSRSEVTLKEYGGGGLRLEALRRGEISATPVNEPWRSLAREEGFNALLDLVPEQIPWLFSGIVVRRDMLALRRDVLERFLKAVLEGNELALADEKLAKAVLAREAKIVDPKIVDIAYEDFRGQTPPNIEPTAAAIANTLAQFPGGSMASADYVDTGIVEALRLSGFAAAMRGRYGRR
jgi:NitT/TauT family transport system substrate-binding protein